jgi:hypothetical protein
MSRYVNELNVPLSNSARIKIVVPDRASPATKT